MVTRELACVHAQPIRSQHLSHMTQHVIIYRNSTMVTGGVDPSILNEVSLWYQDIYKNPVKISEHTNDSGSYFGALGFTLQVELLFLKTVSTASLLAWLTRPTGSHLVEAT